jgi:hypothetical protein
MPTNHTGRLLRLVTLCAALALPLRAAGVRAQEARVEPAHVLALVSTGVPLRLSLHEDLGQDRVAPAFADTLLGYVLPGHGRVQHGVGLGVSTNLERDGGYVEPLYAAQQLVLMPAYLAYAALGRDLPVLGHVGLPMLLGEGRSFGLELGAALGYRMLAGLGLFVEVDVATYVGARSALSVLASAELGVLVDYEVLP